MEVQTVEPNVLLRVLNATWIFMAGLGGVLLAIGTNMATKAAETAAFAPLLAAQLGLPYDTGAASQNAVQASMLQAFGIGALVVAALFAVLALVVHQSQPPRADRHPDLEGSS